MSDLISREALLESLEKEQEIYENNGAIPSFWTALSVIRHAPTVKTEQWIPCRKRMPQSEDKYGLIKCNVTVMRSHYPTSTYDYCDSPYEEYFVVGAIYDASQKIWHIGEHTQLNALIDIEDSPLNGDCVIAWMPLPEPYKGE